MGDGKWETNGVKVNHPTPRLVFDDFESRSTLADPRSLAGRVISIVHLNRLIPSKDQGSGFVID